MSKLYSGVEADNLSITFFQETMIIFNPFRFILYRVKGCPMKIFQNVNLKDQLDLFSCFFIQNAKQ